MTSAIERAVQAIRDSAAAGRDDWNPDEWARDALSAVLPVEPPAEYLEAMAIAAHDVRGGVDWMELPMEVRENKTATRSLVAALYAYHALRAKVMGEAG